MTITAQAIKNARGNLGLTTRKANSQGVQEMIQMRKQNTIVLCVSSRIQTAEAARSGYNASRARTGHIWHVLMVTNSIFVTTAYRTMTKRFWVTEAGFLCKKLRLLYTVV